MYFATDQVLATAKSLVDDFNITRQPGGMVEYFHLLFDTHQIISAKGAPSASFHPGHQALNSQANETREEIHQLFPQLRFNKSNYGPIGASFA